MNKLSEIGFWLVIIGTLAGLGMMLSYTWANNDVILYSGFILAEVSMGSMLLASILKSKLK